MLRFKRLIFLFIIVCMAGISLCSGAAIKKWEPSKVSVEDAKVISKDTSLEIYSLPSLIVINTSQPVKIEIFTILGRLVSAESLPAGRHEFAVDVHGVYIIKAGDLTCKVAL